MSWTTQQTGTYISNVSLQLASASRTTTQTSPDMTTPDKRALHVVLDVTVNAGGAGSITLTIQGKDPASGAYYTVLAGAAVTAVGTTIYRVVPNMAAVANLVASDHLPQVWRILVTANNANPVTYSVGATPIP